MSIVRKTLFASLCLFLLNNAVADSQETSEEPKEGMTAAQFEATLKYQQGEIVLPNGIAALNVPKEFRYLDPHDAERVLVMAWGNPQGSDTLGMLFPAGVSPLAKEGWGVVITYEEDGHVSDEDADHINYDELMQQMQESMASTNEERVKMGYGNVKLVGWAAKPYYDKSSHKMYWAKELQFPDSLENTLNYNIRILGRKGVLVLNAIAGMGQITQVENDMKNVLTFTDFKQGNRYADFNPDMDKLAGYGLAALVAGGIAAKTGLLAKIGIALLAAKKFIVLIVAGIGAILFRVFKRKKV